MTQQQASEGLVRQNCGQKVTKAGVKEASVEEVGLAEEVWGRNSCGKTQSGRSLAEAWQKHGRSMAEQGVGIVCMIEASVSNSAANLRKASRE